MGELGLGVSGLPCSDEEEQRRQPASGGSRTSIHRLLGNALPTHCVFELSQDV